MSKRQKPAKAAGGKKGVTTPQSAPRTASASGSQGTPPPLGTTLPAVIPPLSEGDLNPAQRAELALIRRQADQNIKGAPKGSKMRAKVAAIVAMKIEGLSGEEIAERLNLRPASVRQYLWLAGKHGWLKTADPHVYAEHQLIHRVVSNLEDLLHARNLATGLPDKEVTLEAAKGLGVFKDQKAQEQGPSQNANVLSINFQFPPSPGPLPTVRMENVGGAPAYVEGEVVSKS